MTLSGMETLLMPVFMFLLMLGMGSTLTADQFPSRDTGRHIGGADILWNRDCTAGSAGSIVATALLTNHCPDLTGQY